MKKIIKGDCIKVIKTLQPVDLIYADPPFNIGIFKKMPFKDYLKWCEQWIKECRRVLKPTGSLYLHCDPTASHYLKILMDNIFGIKNFRNEIIWRRDIAGKGGKGVSSQYPRNSDTILFYSMSNVFLFKQLTEELTDKQKSNYTLVEPVTHRKFKAVQLGNYSVNSIKRMEKENLIYVSKTGKEYKKYYLDEAKSLIDCIWTDIYGFGTRTTAKERCGYPTQKPEALLERIIKASSNEGDLVLDPFCGSGTTCVAAKKLNRNYIGIDVSNKAIDISKKRIKCQIN